MSGSQIVPQWFQRLLDNPHIEALLLADTRGRMLRSSRELSSDHERVASMLQSLEVLAQALADEFACGRAQFVQLATQDSHILLLPLLDSQYFLVVQVKRSAPLTLLMIELDRVVQQVRISDLRSMEVFSPVAEDPSPLNAAELIEAVQEWLHNRPH